MDATTFYGSTFELPSKVLFYGGVNPIEKHGKTRHKANISAVEQIFLAIADGNLSDANLPDNEAEVSDDVVNVDIDLGGLSNASAPAVEESSDSYEEDDAIKKKCKKSVNWVK
ncbi:hypothetical protein MRX96_025702 [Rhipicephalus microplus]